MGCDIHCCIEFASSRSPDGSCWNLLPFDCDVNLGRDYDHFALMAGARSTEQIKPIFEPRGLPADVSDTFRMRSVYRIDDDLAAHEVDRYCTRDEAESWIRDRLAVAIGDDMVSNPDSHSESWLVVAELEEVQRRYGILTESDHPELDAVIAAMRVLDGNNEGRSRLVFWFKG